MTLWVYVLGAIEPDADRAALIDGISQDTPPCPLPTDTTDRPDAHSDHDHNKGGEVELDEGAKRLRERDRTDPASRSDAIYSSSNDILTLIREAKDRYHKPRRPRQIPRRASCDRARAHRTQPRYEELPAVEKLRRTNYSLEAKVQDGFAHAGFSLNLSLKVEKLASQQSDVLDWLFRLIRRHTGDLCPLIVMTAEVAFVADAAERARRRKEGLRFPDWRLHVHGELACPAALLGARERRFLDKATNKPRSTWTSAGPGASVYNTLIKAAGAWEDPTYQLDFIQNPGHRWLTGYATKLGMRYKMSNELRRLVRADYESSREMANARMKRVLSKTR